MAYNGDFEVHDVGTVRKLKERIAELETELQALKEMLLPKDVEVVEFDGGWLVVDKKTGKPRDDIR